jgi:trehalose/maltose hydrolase-like predicted phosphorylase
MTNNDALKYETTFEVGTQATVAGSKTVWVLTSRNEAGEVWRNISGKGSSLRNSAYDKLVAIN